MRQVISIRFIALLTAASSVLSCALACSSTPPAFAAKFGDNDTDAISDMLMRVRNAPPRNAGTIGVFITPEPKRLYAADLESGRVLWQQPTSATSAPFLAGELAIFETATSIVGVSLKTGARAFEHDRGSKQLRGVDGEGPLAAFALSEGMGSYAKSEVVLARRGSIDWRRQIDGTVGVPAIVGALVLVPWSNQYLSAIDATSGRELARARVRDGVIAHAVRDRDQTYAGSLHGITKVGESIGSGTLKGAGYFRLPEQVLPGRPQLLRDVYTEVAPATADSATHRITLAWEPKSFDQVRMGLEDDVAYLVFYRFVLALEVKDYAVRWVHVAAKDIVGASAQPGGVVVVEENGKLSSLSANAGEVVRELDTQLPATVARLPLGGLPLAAGTIQDAATQRARLLAAAQDTDSRLVPARVMAVQALAQKDDAEATTGLITLCDDGALSPPVQREACALLSKRVLGEEQLLVALGRHAGYLEGTTAPPVGALASAAVTLKERRAVAPLIEHLNDPATPSRDLLPLVTALGQLGDAGAAAPLASFLRLYHADAVDEPIVGALQRIPEALAALDPAAAKATLELVMGDEQGIYTVRTKARDVLATITAKEAAEQQAAAEAKQPEAPPPVDTTPSVPIEQLMPTHITNELLEQALLPVRDQLQQCVRSLGPMQFQARAVLVVEEGQLLMVSVLPQTLQGCVEPLMRGQTYPRTRYSKKERVTYVIKRGS